MFDILTERKLELKVWRGETIWVLFQVAELQGLVGCLV